MTKFAKGSKAAKEFMAKLRAARKSAKKKVKTVKKTVKKIAAKRKISGETHTDNKSHNYRINISGLKSDAINSIHNLNKRIENSNAFIEHTKKQLLDKQFSVINKKHFRNSIKLAKKYITGYKKQIAILKKHI